MTKLGFKKWTSIDKFSDAVKLAQKNLVTIVHYKDKVKLHGTNAGVRIETDGSVAFQKRTSDVVVGDDNAGFAAWATHTDWEKINKIYGDVTYIIWGEWAGEGIGHGDAVNMLKTKTFFIFSVEVFHSETDVMIVGEPDTIKEIVSTINLGPNVEILPWDGDEYKVKVYGDSNGDTVSPQEYANYINEKIERMEVRDDYIFGKFGIDKSGEGFVCYPSLDGNFVNIPRDVFGSYVFKAKTSAHVAGKVKGAKVKVEIPTSFIDFANTYATEPRFEQMIREHCNGEYSMKDTPTFLRAVIADIEKETVNEREEGGVDMKDVQKVISTKAVMWLKHKCTML